MKTIKERFWSKVDKNGLVHPHNPALGNCWQWTASKNYKGYGTFECKDENKAHRASWEIHNGQIPDGKWVLHSCDNRACVNPSHLFLGDGKANALDMVAKGRHARTCGEDMPTHRLTESQVSELLNTPYKRGSTKIFAIKFGVNAATINRARAGKSWKHLQPTQPTTK